MGLRKKEKSVVEIKLLHCNICIHHHGWAGLQDLDESQSCEMTLYSEIVVGEAFYLPTEVVSTQFVAASSSSSPPCLKKQYMITLCGRDQSLLFDGERGG